MINFDALRRLVQGPVRGELRPDADSNLQMIGLRQRMMADMDARNKALLDAGQPAYAQERPDPNLGTMSLLAQAVNERGRLGDRRALMRNRIFEKDALFGGR